MSFLGKMVAKAVVKKAEDVAMKGVLNHLENTRSVDALVKNSTANYMLFIKKKSVAMKRAFTVCDEFDNQQYMIRTDTFTFGYPSIRLLDNNNHEIGKVELTSKFGMGNYTMHLDGKTLGTFRPKSSAKIKFDLSFNGWRLDGNLMQNNFVVTDRNENEVMKFNDAFTEKETYVLELNNREHEVLGLLLVMAVELILHHED